MDSFKSDFMGEDGWKDKFDLFVGDGSGTVERFDPLSGIWTELRHRLPYDLQWTSAAGLDARLYVIGGKCRQERAEVLSKIGGDSIHVSAHGRVGVLLDVIANHCFVHRISLRES